MLHSNASPECSTEHSPPLLLRKNVTKVLHSFQAQMISADYAKDLERSTGQAERRRRLSGLCLHGSLIDAIGDIPERNYARREFFSP
jgi:hypothetical protein